MSTVLVAYDTGEGQTAKIADYVGSALAERGHDVQTTTVGEVGNELVDADAIVVGASIHMGAHQDSVVEFSRANRDVLDRVPSAFFQVSLSSAAEDPERQADAARYVDEFREATDWHPRVVGAFAGAIQYSKYGFVKRYMMKKIAADATGDTDTSRDYEYTDWRDVDAFVDAVDALATGEGTSSSTSSDEQMAEPVAEPTAVGR